MNQKISQMRLHWLKWYIFIPCIFIKGLTQTDFPIIGTQQRIEYTDPSHWCTHSISHPNFQNATHNLRDRLFLLLNCSNWKWLSFMLSCLFPLRFTVQRKNKMQSTRYGANVSNLSTFYRTKENCMEEKRIVWNYV